MANENNSQHKITQIRHETTPVLIECYGTRWLNQAWSDFIAKLKQEATFSGISGVIVMVTTVVLFFFLGTTLVTALPVVVFLALLLGYFAFVLFRAPAKLDAARQDEINALRQLEGIAADMEARDKLVDELGEMRFDGFIILHTCENGELSAKEIETKTNAWIDTTATFLEGKFNRQCDLEFVGCVREVPKDACYTSQAHEFQASQIYPRLIKLDDFKSQLIIGSLKLSLK